MPARRGPGCGDRLGVEDVAGGDGHVRVVFGDLGGVADDGGDGVAAIEGLADDGGADGAGCRAAGAAWSWDVLGLVIAVVFLAANTSPSPHDGTGQPPVSSSLSTALCDTL